MIIIFYYYFLIKKIEKEFLQNKITFKLYNRNKYKKKDKNIYIWEIQNHNKYDTIKIKNIEKYNI